MKKFPAQKEKYLSVQIFELNFENVCAIFIVLYATTALNKLLMYVMSKCSTVTVTYLFSEIRARDQSVQINKTRLYLTIWSLLKLFMFTVANSKNIYWYTSVLYFFAQIKLSWNHTNANSANLNQHEYASTFNYT